MTITTSNPDTGSDLQTEIYFPSGDGSSVDPSEAAYATLVFARGFMSFPTSYSGWGEHLASWGYILAIPDFPSEDREDRASDVQHLVSYLENEDSNAGSPFFQRIDVDRFGLMGHSAGGLSTMIVASRDERIKAAVALDPAGSATDGWDYEAEAPPIGAPLAVIGAPSQTCNNSAAYDDWYPHVGSTHKAKFVIVDASHCDFMDTDDELQVQLCSVLCGASSQDRLVLAERYATAWFNYYLHHETDYYTYLYGDEADADIQADRITRDVHTAPRDVTATGRSDAVGLSWTLYDHPMVAGYNVYRSQLSGDYPSVPTAQVGHESVYTDTDVVEGERYYYVLRSRDGAGNEHQASDEVSVTAGCSRPTASFEADPTDCCAPLTAVFTDTSIADTSAVPTNTIESWYWQFGDGGGSSTEQNPSYTYEQAGVYTVTLTVTDSQSCSDTVVQASYIAANPRPTASFDAGPTGCCAPLTAVFTDTSMADTSIVPTNTIEAWHWQFGDGRGTSSERNPRYTYDQAGVYTVTLTVTDSHRCSDTLVQAGCITANPGPVTSFGASPTDCCAPLAVVFADTSIADTSVVPTNTIEGWYWQFGDGVGSSSEQNPTYTYEQAGVYTVTLTVTDSHGCSDKVVQTSYIAANPPPAASFDVSPTVGQVPLDVTLTDTSVADTSIVAANRIEGWHWDFGDGVASSSEQNPSYTYEQPGAYTVTLTVTDSHGCSDDARQTVTVVDEFDNFIYLPLVDRGGSAEPRGAGWELPQHPRALLGEALHWALRLLSELSTRPSGLRG